MRLNKFPASIYLLKVNNRNTRPRSEICSKLTKKHQNVIDIVLASLLLTVNKCTHFSSASIVDFKQVNVGWDLMGTLVVNGLSKNT